MLISSFRVHGASPLGTSRHIEVTQQFGRCWSGADTSELFAEPIYEFTA